MSVDEGQDRKRLFQLSPVDEINRTKELTIKGIGLLSRNSQTLDQGAHLLKQIIPTLTTESMPSFLQILFQVKASPSKPSSQPKAARQVVRILGECVQVQPEISLPYVRKIIHYILSHLQSPEGSIEKMHEQCALALTDIAISVPPGPIIGGLFQCYFTKRRIGESFFHTQMGASLCLQAIFKTTEVIEYLKSNDKSLSKVISKLLSLISSQNEFAPFPVLQVWYVVIENIEQCHIYLRQSAPQLISNTVQALSSGATSDSKKNFSSETSIFWKNRAEAARLLSLLPEKLPVYITKPYGNEVLQYLEQSRHDRIQRVRDEVSAAIAAWKKLMNLPTEEKRTGTARMDFSGFSYKNKSTPSPSSGKRVPLRQFIQQSRKSTPRTQDPVVLIPRNSSPAHKEVSPLTLFASEGETDTPSPKPVEFENWMNFNESSDSIKMPEKIDDKDDDEFDVLSLSEFPDTPTAKPMRQRYLPYDSPYSSSPASCYHSPLQHLAPTPLFFETPSIHPVTTVEYNPPQYVQIPTSNQPTPQPKSPRMPTNTRQSSTNKQMTPETSYIHPDTVNDIEIPKEIVKQAEQAHTDERDLLEQIYEMNHQITEVYRKQIAMVDSIIPGETSKDELAQMLQQQHKEIASLTKHVSSLETAVETKMVSESEKDSVPDAFKEREGIPQEQWEQTKATIVASTTDRNSEQLSTVFSFVLMEGDFTQCIFLMEKSFIMLESLSLEEFHLAFDFIHTLTSYSCCQDLRSLWLQELLKTYTPLKPEHRTLLLPISDPQ